MPTVCMCSMGGGGGGGLNSIKRLKAFKTNLFFEYLEMSLLPVIVSGTQHIVLMFLQQSQVFSVT